MAETKLLQNQIQCIHIGLDLVLGPTQVKCRLLISSIFYVMNFQHFLEMLEFNLWHF